MEEYQANGIGLIDEKFPEIRIVNIHATSPDQRHRNEVMFY